MTDEDSMAAQSIPHREAVGSLIYLANCTRPDIAVAVGVLSRFLQNPGRVHWEKVKRVFLH